MPVCLCVRVGESDQARTQAATHTLYYYRQPTDDVARDAEELEASHIQSFAENIEGGCSTHTLTHTRTHTNIHSLTSTHYDLFTILSTRAPCAEMGAGGSPDVAAVTLLSKMRPETMIGAEWAQVRGVAAAWARDAGGGLGR
jgi:hypothetical protein